MTLITPNGDELPSEEILAAAIEEYERSIRDVREMIARVERGELPLKSEARDKFVRLRVMTQLAMQERDRLEERRKKEVGCVHGYALDFGAARDEIRRRLARLRAAGSAGRVPDGSG